MDLYKFLLDYAELKNMKLMPYQKEMLKAFCQDRAIVIPRQNGRSSIIERMMIDYCQELTNREEK